MIWLWLILNTIFRLGIVGIIAHKLMHYRELFNPAERIGMSVGASGALLTIPTLVYGPLSPFEGWGSCLLSFGWLLYLCGRMSRHIRHKARNDAQAAQMERELARRGRR